MHITTSVLLATLPITLSGCGRLGFDPDESADGALPDAGDADGSSITDGRVDSGPIGLDAGPVDSDASGLDASGLDASGLDASGLDASASDGGAALDSGGPDSGLGPATIRLTNVVSGADCSTFVRPSDGEHGHWLAVRLTPTLYPHWVMEIEYTIENRHSQDCHAEFPHRVQVYASTSVSPPATPVPHEEILVDLPDTTPQGNTVVRLVLGTPLRLDAGEDVFVAIELVGSGASELCVETCDEAAPGRATDRNWWSDSTTPPYPWRTSIITVAQVATWGSE